MSPPVVMGGTTPGHSTDAVGAMLASAVKADRFVIATDVDGIYDSDPKKNANAKKYDIISIKELRKMSPPVVMGGTTPGHSTDAVGAMLASAVKADRFVIATDVDGIYDSDPKKNKDAKKFDSISIKELRRLSPDTWDKAGKSSAIDGIACRIIDENRISTYVVNGKDLESLENAIYGREFRGTIIEV
ncbi:MAG: hypothetical protein DRN31_03180 [Thermoplasmata archaeon]|nr:MAG: hypothetical protein DRN31_03180 [Thermoplasmata archaeon]